MSFTDKAGAGASAGALRADPLYFAVWRWHFYAGLYVVPFLMMLAVTGMIMIWFTTIAPEYGEGLMVAPAAAPLAMADQERAALAAVAGATALNEYVAPFDASHAALFKVAADKAVTVVALDPYSGTALRVTPDGATWAALAERIHGTLMIGTFGDRLIEIAASLGLMLVVTGGWLWWPRNGRPLSDLFLPRLGARGRGFWKSLHRALGGWTALILTLFLLTGLAWAGVWGGRFVQAWSSFPAEKFANVPLSDATHASMNHTKKEVPWALEQTPMPASGSDAGVTGVPAGTPVTLDSLVALGRAIGFDGRFHVKAPEAADGVWTLSRDSMSYDSSDPTSDRTVHVDRYTGQILADVRFADYSAGGKAMAAGIALHEGQAGLWNLILNLIFCLAVLALCLSGIAMWWLRRPSRALRLAAPPAPPPGPPAISLKGPALIALVMGLAFPMLGATLVAVLALDRGLRRLAPALWLRLA